ncbi:MAG TPA: aldehyde dehydrogenase family protein, partial [Planctomycetes bacterium]|nr:aldehyde dehydrogenase family protein [Planctomycetota bacterium]
ELLFPGEKPEPVGVVGQIIPWNFPLLMAAWKIAPALAAGNTVVIKPAETSPLTALRLCEVFEQAELPAGVVNVVTGDGSTGAALVRHPDLNKVAFTGSTEVGKEIQKAVAGRSVDLTLELGGKAAHLVFEDAALDQAVEGVVRGIFFNQGHVCCAGSRLIVQESVHDLFVRKLQRRMARIRVGDPLDKNTDMGAIHSSEQLMRIRGLVQSGVDEGAVLFQPKCALPKNGFWFVPSMFTGVTQSHRISREEIFGPVLSVSTFRTPEEAVEKANNTSYGLSAVRIFDNDNAVCTKFLDHCRCERDLGIQPRHVRLTRQDEQMPAAFRLLAHRRRGMGSMRGRRGASGTNRPCQSRGDQYR